MLKDGLGKKRNWVGEEEDALPISRSEASKMAKSNFRGVRGAPRFLVGGDDWSTWAYIVRS